MHGHDVIKKEIGVEINHDKHETQSSSADIFTKLKVRMDQDQVPVRPLFEGILE